MTIPLILIIGGIIILILIGKHVFGEDGGCLASPLLLLYYFVMYCLYALCYFAVGLGILWVIGLVIPSEWIDSVFSFFRDLFHSVLSK